MLNSNYIGDDCAYLPDLGIVVTQDSLVEGVHFSLDYMTPYQLGYKSVMVNLSDIASSGANPKYLTIALSLPSNIDENFIDEFYKGAQQACGGEIKIVGGDITGADKVYVSVSAIGATEYRKIASRKNAKVGYKVVVAGLHGSSAAGLRQLLAGNNAENNFTKAHLEPMAQVEFGKNIGKNIQVDYAMMDTSDGLMDALSTIANESAVLLEVYFDKIPYDYHLVNFEDIQDLVLFGGEDYGIVAVVPKDLECGGVEIGEVKKGLGVDLRFGQNVTHYSKEDVENKIYNHFEGKDEI
ncbi:thiamine-phosphate kinase [bacterium]|nr:thiamine-phosphate kinase [bacterium]